MWVNGGKGIYSIWIESQLLSFSTLVRSLSLSLSRAFLWVGGLVAERYLTVYTQASPRRYKRVYDAVMHIEYETLLARDGQTYVDHEPPRCTGKAYSLLRLYYSVQHTSESCTCGEEYMPSTRSRAIACWLVRCQSRPPSHSRLGLPKHRARRPGGRQFFT